MMHAGVLKKVGLYVLLRVAQPFFPEAMSHWATPLAILAMGNVLYCGWVALRQRDLYLLLGNSSLAHMGFCFLGLAASNVIGVTGVVLIMVAHGLLAALSFGLAGHLTQVTGTSDLDRLGGLLKSLPFVGSALIMAFLAGCGLPGFANFPGELTVLFGAWKSFPVFVIAAAWGGLLIGGVYMLRAIRDLLHGPLREGMPKGGDAGAWRRVPFLTLLAALLYFGVNPASLVDRITPSAERLAASGPSHAPLAAAAAVSSHAAH
jgi:NADH-quinone oxidoreductase subunit M